MNLRRMSLGVILVALLSATLACGGEVSVSTAKVADAYMSTDEGGTDRTTAYAQDAVFYAQVDLQNAPDTDPGLVINETEYTTGSDVYFTLSNNDLWPIGTYKVDIHLDGELVDTINFSVQ